jgi:hypothetical protein
LTIHELIAKCEILAPCGDAMAATVLELARERDQVKASAETAVDAADAAYLAVRYALDRIAKVSLELDRTHEDLNRAVEACHTLHNAIATAIRYLTGIGLAGATASVDVLEKARGEAVKLLSGGEET